VYDCLAPQECLCAIQGFAEAGGISAALALVEADIYHAELAKAACALLRQLANNDANKARIIELKVTVIPKHGDR
jgi:hypothetical protein